MAAYDLTSASEQTVWHKAWTDHFLQFLVWYSQAKQVWSGFVVVYILYCWWNCVRRFLEQTISKSFDGLNETWFTLSASSVDDIEILFCGLVHSPQRYFPRDSVCVCLRACVHACCRGNSWTVMITLVFSDSLASLFWKYSQMSLWHRMTMIMFA